MRNIYVKLFWIWASGSEDVVLNISYLEPWRPHVQWSETIYAILEGCIMRNIHVKLF